MPRSSAVDIGVANVLPNPREIMSMPNNVVDKVGSFLVIGLVNLS
jgi:hypothetical protein